MKPIPPERSSIPTIGKVSAGLVACVALASLIGWVFELETLTRVSANWVAMNPMTAVSFLCLVAAIGLLSANTRPGLEANLKESVAYASLLFVGVCATLRLIAYAAGTRFGIDSLVFGNRVGEAMAVLPSGMAPNTALSFLMASSSLLFLDSTRWRWIVLSHGPALLVVLTAFVSVVGYSVGARSLYQPVPFAGMAAHTAICFILLGIAILSLRTKRGIARILSSRRMGGTMARRILPVVLLLPLAVVWLLIRGHSAGLYDTAVGVGLLILSSVILLVTITLLTANSLNKIDGKRRRSEKNVRLTARRLAHALDITQSAILTLDDEDNILTFGERATKLFGFEDEEVLGRPIATVLPSFASVRNSKSNSRKKKPVEATARRRDGSEFFAEMMVSTFTDHGKQLRAVVVRDITDRKRAEEESLQRELLAAANEELESFTYSVSHDLRAPLRHVDGFVKLLRKNVQDALDEKGDYYLSVIADSANQMGVLIDDLLSFSRMTRAEMSKQETDLGQLVEGIVEEFSRETEGRNVDWVIHSLPTLECDRSMMRQVYANLIGNALKFTRDRDPAIIEIGVQDVADDDSPNVFFVRDNGVGFDMEYKDKLFGVFQRLHRQEEFEGTGIGLANVRRIVRRHGGDAWGEGEPDKGATLYFSLPAKVEAIA